MKKIAATLFLLLFTGFIMALSIIGPEFLSRYRDKAVLGEVRAMAIGTESEGYRSLSRGEKLYILSQGLESQTLPESAQYSLTRNHEEALEYEDLNGTYSFIVNRTESSGTKITESQVYHACSQGLDALKELGILPDTVREVENENYDAVLYSAIDVLEPRNNVTVWKLGLSNIQKIKDKENWLIDAYIDAEDGKIYEFYVRTPLLWADINPDNIAEQWSRYMGLSSPVPIEDGNPLMETTPYYKEYAFPGIGNEATVVTVGFYEGINELFLKISK